MLSTGLLIGFAALGCLVCLMLAFSGFGNRYGAESTARLKDLAQPRAADLAKRREAGESTTGSKSEESGGYRVHLRRWMDRLLPDSHADQRLHQTRMFNAGIYHPSALRRFFAAKLLLMILPLALGLLAAWQHLIPLRSAMLYGAIAGAAGLILPSFWLDHRIAVRHQQLRRSLPDFLDLMIVCFDGGLSLQGAIQRVSDELKLAHPILALEMQTVQRDVELGATVEVALRNLADRTGLDNLRTLSTFVRESMRFGTELSETLRMHAEMLRTQREQAAEAQAQRAAVHILLPTLLLILPAVFVVVAGPAAIQIHETFSKRGSK